MDRSIKVTLKCKVKCIWTIVVLYGKLLNLFFIIIEDIFAELTLGEREWNILDLSVHGTISLIVPDC
jgi:hypothetical protein